MFKTYTYNLKLSILYCSKYHSKYSTLKNNYFKMIYLVIHSKYFFKHCMTYTVYIVCMRVYKRERENKQLHTVQYTGRMRTIG